MNDVAPKSRTTHTLDCFNPGFSGIWNGELEHDLLLQAYAFRVGDEILYRERLSDEIGHTGRVIRAQVIGVDDDPDALWYEDGHVLVQIKVMGRETPPLPCQLQGNEHATTKPSRTSVRTFVCQGCGKSAVVLYGSAIKCQCGVWSAAEVLS